MAKRKKRRPRLKPYFTPDLIEAGCDEVGRGCLAGPVVAAAVILPKDFRLSGLNDSKQLKATERVEMSVTIRKRATAWAVAEVCPNEIDQLNILNASYKAMYLAIQQLSTIPELLLVDGNRFINQTGIRHECIIKGDGKYLSIAAASVLAKTYRDELMGRLAQDFPHYGWVTNVGYPTVEHREGLKKYGSTIHHRKSFQLLPNQLELFEAN